MCFKVAERWLPFQVSWLIQAECEDGARTGGKEGRDKEGEEAGPVGSLQEAGAEWTDVDPVGSRL